MDKHQTDFTAGVDYIPRAEVLELLGVKAETLYTYVSRGLIRRVPHPDKKQSLYCREDVEKIRARSAARSREGVVAAGAIRHGEPIIPTSITEITPNGARYRNRSAVDLAQAGYAFEAVAELLWSGLLIEEPLVWRRDPLPAEFLRLADALGGAPAPLPIHQLFSFITTSLGLGHSGARARIRQGDTIIAAARQLCQALTGCFGYLSPRRGYRPAEDGEGVAEAIARSLDIDPSPATLRLLNVMLVLLADHELSPATFVARIAASSEADFYACINAGICTHSGARIARACDWLEDFFSDAASDTQLLDKLRSMEMRGKVLPGFNHPMYPKGDPRALLMLESIRPFLPGNPRLRAVDDFVREVASRHQLYPQIEVGIVMVGLALELPPQSAMGIYTLGRTAGWVAHMMEQWLNGYLIRPRAKYVGPGSEYGV